MAGRRPASELADLWRRLRRSDVFPADPVGGLLGFAGVRNHLVSQAGLRRLLRRNLQFERLEDAPIRFHVVATEVLSGTDVRLDSGPAVDAVLASSAIPGVFAPVEVDGVALMDGGIVNNTPISHAVALGASRVWVLATGYSCAMTEPPRSALGVVLQAVTVAIHQRLALDVERYADVVDLRVVPPLCPVAVPPTDFSKADSLIERGYAHTSAWLTGETRARDAETAAAPLRPHRH